MATKHPQDILDALPELKQRWIDWRHYRDSAERSNNPALAYEWSDADAVDLLDFIAYTLGWEVWE